MSSCPIRAIRPGLDGLLFTGEKGNPLRRGSFNQRVKWVETVKDMGRAGLHFHDLRHAGNVWAAQTKVSTKDRANSFRDGRRYPARSHQLGNCGTRVFCWLRPETIDMLASLLTRTVDARS